MIYLACMYFSGLIINNNLVPQTETMLCKAQILYNNNLVVIIEMHTHTKMQSQITAPCLHSMSNVSLLSNITKKI